MAINMIHLIYLLFISLISIGQPQPNNDLYDLIVDVHNLRNNEGEVLFALYNKDGTIPDEKYKHFYLKGTSPIWNNSAKYVFTSLPKGKYAVNILHDENLNGKIDKRIIPPTPKEGIGFSNYESIGLRNKPNVPDASFNLDSTMVINITIIYM